MSIFRAYDIRGIYGKDLNEETMTRIGEAAGTYCPGAFTIGRDFREHGAQLEKAFVSGFEKNRVKRLSCRNMSCQPVCLCELEN